MDLIDTVLDRSRALVERRVRLGVTGLSRAGKTVFVTALVHALLHPDRLTAFGPVSSGRYKAAVLRPQPRQNIPRFAYEDAVARLTGSAGMAPEWPDSTRRVAELRVSVRYTPDGMAARLGDRVLHIDIFDYPGEWLLDLELMSLSFGAWSARMAERVERDRHRLPEAAAWLDAVAGAPLDDPTLPGAEAERWAIDLARLYTAWLEAVRVDGGGPDRLQPGRFLMPGDLEGSPLMTFSPLPPQADTGDDPRNHRGRRNTPRRLMAERYDSYVDRVVRPFFRDHFARLDRQIVLFDLLSHLEQPDGPDRAVAALIPVLETLKLGSSWMPRWLSPHIDRVLFAATKADHVPSDQHARMQANLDHVMAEGRRRVAFSGAELSMQTLAALRSTVDAKPKGPWAADETYVSGKRAGDGRSIAHYPGPVPEPGIAPAANGFQVAKFAPPDGLAASASWPHIRLDRALDFLVGDLTR